MLQQGTVDAPAAPADACLFTYTGLPPTAHAAFPAAGTSEHRLDDTVAASPEPAPLAETTWVAATTATPAATEAVGAAEAAEAVGAAASAALAQDGLPGDVSADKALQGRPASASAPVADLPAPKDWQASEQMEPAMAEQTDMC